VSEKRILPKEIDDCGKCPFRVNTVIKDGNDECKIENRYIHSDDIGWDYFPDWCPLPKSTEAKDE
jgi:hypothetical protein